MLKRLGLTMIAVSLLFLSACSEKELSQLKNNSNVEVKGKLTTLGNSPFHYPALVLKDGHQVKLVFKTIKQKEKAKQLMGERIDVQGVLKIEEMRLLKKEPIKSYKIIVNSFK